MTTEPMAEVLAFFKALSDKSRLMILGTVGVSERSVEELASLLDLQGPTISHHLSRLKDAGLVRMRQEGNTNLYSLNSDRLEALSKKILSVQQFAIDESRGDVWEKKIIRDFFEGYRLKVIPASRKKRQVILAWLADSFEPDKRYSEKAVNTMIKRHHEDFATLRRELIGAKLLQRTNDGVYWRPAQA